MCCLFCITFRGAAYFGTTLQLLLGFGIVAKYFTPFFTLLGNWQDIPSPNGPVIVVIFTYGVLITLFGCFIFRGIEIESLRALKVFVGGLTVLQCLVLISHLTLFALSFDTLTEDERMAQVSALSGNLVLTFILLTVYFLYMIRLARRRALLWLTHGRTNSSRMGTGSMRTRSRSGSDGGSSSSVPLSTTTTTTLATLTKPSSNRNGQQQHRESVCSFGSLMVGPPPPTPSSLAQRYVDGQWENLQ